MRTSFRKGFTCLLSLFFFGSLRAQQAHIGASSYATIQQAINAASPGSVITLDAGAFYENVVINKPVTIKGAGTGLTTIYPAISGPTCGVAASICPGSSNVMLVQAHNVTIRDLTIDGDNPMLTSGVVRNGRDINARNGIITNHAAGIFNNLVVSEVVVKSIYLRGIYASSGGTFNFSHNTVWNVSGEGASIAIMNFGGAGTFLANNVLSSNDGIVSNWSKGTVYSSNLVIGCGSGIHSDNNQVSGDLIENNTVINSAANGYGIWIYSPYVSAQIRDNRVRNVDVAFANSGQAAPGAFPVFTNNVIDGEGKANSVGVYQTSERWGFGTTNVNGKYENNVIINTDYAFYIELSPARTNNIVAKYNSITGNTYNVETSNATGATLTNDLSCNWWGTNDVSVFGATINPGINYTPWLTTGNDSFHGIGFQPSASCNGTSADLDGDGVFNANDCDPLDPAVGAPANVFFRDMDGDGYGDPSSSITICSSATPAGYVSNNYDSDDTDGKGLIWVCHKGNSIIIKANALQAHIGHGDVAGNCNAQRSVQRRTGIVESFDWNIYPNPARSELKLAYTISRKAKVDIAIYDQLGRKVQEVFNGSRDAGSHHFSHPVAKLPAGVYFVRFTIDDGESVSAQTMKFTKMD